MSITFIGTNGIIGSSLITHFYQKNPAITVIADYQNPSPTPINWQIGCLRDTPFLHRALQGTTDLILNFSDPPYSKPTDFIPERDIIANLISIAQYHQIRIHTLAPLYLNAIGIRGFNWWRLRIKEHAITQLRTSPIPVIFYHHSLPMELLTIMAQLKSGLVIPKCTQRGYYWIATSDIVDSLIQSISLPHANQPIDYYLQGPERLIPISAAKRLAHYQPHISVTRIPYWPIQITALFSKRIRYIDQLIQAATLRDEPFLADSTWATLGQPQLTLASFASTPTHDTL